MAKAFGRDNIKYDATGRAIREDESKSNKKIEKWIYRSIGKNSCEACIQNNGKEFKTLKEAPKLPIHPNCNCYLETIYAEQDLTDLERALGDVLNSSDNLQQSENSLSEIKGKTESRKHKGMVNNVLEKTSKWDNVIGDFTKHYYDLVNGNRTDDKGAHHDANEEASGRGFISGEVIARMINWSHEVVDGIHQVVAEGENVISVIQDAFEDMDANEQGIKDGRENRK